MNEIVKVNPNELITDEYFDLILQKEEVEARVKAMDKAMNESMMNYFDETGETKFEFVKDGIKLTWSKIAETDSHKVDYDQLKEDGLYERYVTDSKKKGYVRMSVKYE